LIDSLSVVSFYASYPFATFAFRGPSGSGKNRALNATRLNSYRPFYDQSTKRVPSIYRPLDLWRGSLFIDECDFSRTDETSDLIHYLNCRCYGTPIARQRPDNPSISEVFQNFGLTVVTQRRPWEDNATEDRTIPFYCERSQKQLPTTELDEWILRGLDLQDKLLYLRLSLFKKVEINKSARINGVKDVRLTASVLPLLALEPFAPTMVKDLRSILVEIEKRRKEVKAQSRDGIIVNALWDRVSEGLFDEHNRVAYVGSRIEIEEKRDKQTASESNGVVVPLVTSELEEILKWKSRDIRSVVTSLQLCTEKPPQTARVDGKLYRPIWFSPSRLENRLEEFVVDYQQGELAQVLASAVKRKSRLIQISALVINTRPKRCTNRSTRNRRNMWQVGTRYTSRRAHTARVALAV